MEVIGQLHEKFILCATEKGLVIIDRHAAQERVHYEEYKAVLLEELTDKEVSIVYNINVGHATPRCIVPFGVHAQVDVDEQVIRFDYNK